MSRKKKKPTTAPRKAGSKQAPGRSSAQKSRGRGAAGNSSRGRVAARQSMQAARYLWAVVTALVIAALLFEPTWSWTVGVGTYMVALGEFTGLWLIVSGYVMCCTPAAFGLLIATGRFWPSMTHALWIGALYGVLGFFLLDTALGLLM